MALLDGANTGAYGNPEITEVNIGVRNNPGILVSGHDLKDLEQLLEQTKGTGVDVYTHSEMLPAHYYPAFKKYDNFVGNYGNAWWKQKEEFATFNGPILMTTNCIVPPADSYKERLWTTGAAGYPGCRHIEGEYGTVKDFSAIIEQAKTCAPPQEIETGSIIGGFAHEQVFALADKVVDEVKSGAIRKFVVMGGCDGRMKSRDYYTDFAKKLPKDVVILTAGCAKYKYNKLALGDIGGIPRVLDAGQCNDSYSLALIALKLKEVFGLDDINDLPIAFNIAWYEQKAVIVLLALLYLGVKNIHLGPTLPGFLSQCGESSGRELRHRRYRHCGRRPKASCRRDNIKTYPQFISTPCKPQTCRAFLCMNRRSLLRCILCLSVLCHNHGCGIVSAAAVRRSGVWPPPLYPGASFGCSPFQAGLLLLPSVDLPLPCGQIAVVLLHKGCSGVIRPFERLHIGIAVLFQNTGQPVHPAVDLLLYTFNLFLQGLALFSFEQSSRFSELPFQLWKLYVHELLNRPGFVLYLAHQLLHGAVFRHIN